MKIGILGAGTWGTALANAFSDRHDVTLWSRFESEVISLRTTLRHKHLPGVPIAPNISFTSSIEEAVKDKDIILFVTPSTAVRATAELIKPYAEPNQYIVDAAKGIEEGTLFTLSEVIKDVLGQEFNVTCLSGPTHAEEVSVRLPTAIVAANKDIKTAELIQKELSLPYMRVYTNKDIKGVELAGALKNVIALAAGVSEGIGFGDNAKAAIVTRGLNEITRLGVAFGANKDTFSGLTGIGDIVVTATSKHSRNHNAGFLLGKGYSLEDTLKEVGMVVEGINCLKAAKELSTKLNVEMPIVDAIYNLIFNGLSPKETVQSLLSRDLKHE